MTTTETRPDPAGRHARAKGAHLRLRLRLPRLQLRQAERPRPARRAVRRAPLRLPPAAHQGGREDPLARGVLPRVERRRDLRHGHRGLRHGHDRRAAAAAHRPVPRRPVSVGEVCGDGRQASRPRRVLGLGQPARGQEGARPDGGPGQGVRRQGVQVLQRPLRLRPAVPVAHGRPARRLPGLREGAGARRQPDRGPQGRAARAAARRAHAHVRHGRRRRELPRHQLRHLPRRACRGSTRCCGRSCAIRTSTRRSPRP